MNRLSLLCTLVVSVALISSCGVTRRSSTSNSSSTSTKKTTPSVTLISATTTSTSSSSNDINAIETGVASWYGPDFHGRSTANGEKYDMDGFTAAHRTLPFNTKVLVENLDNGKTVEVRINDRGPFSKDRIIDLSKGAASKVDMIGPGTARVRVYLIGGDPSSLNNLKEPNYTVQLGSYSDKVAAEKKAAEIRSSYVKEVEVDNKLFYRIYFGDFKNPAIALEAQKRLEGLGHNGFVKLVDHD